MSEHGLTDEEIQKINKEINDFMFEPSYITSEITKIKNVRYVTGKEVEINIEIATDLRED